MEKLPIYPKGKGEPFNLVCDRFELKTDRFIIYDADNKEFGFLSFANVAAIVPERQPAKDLPFPQTPTRFAVYLRDRLEPVPIWAHVFKIEENSRLAFWFQKKDISSYVESEWPMTYIYVALSEVIAILPSAGSTGTD